MQHSRLWVAAAALWGIVGVAGCDDSPTTEVERDGSELRVVRGRGTVTATIDRDGARLELEERAALTVERRLLEEPRDFELTALEVRDLERNPAPGTPLGRPFVVRPEELRTREPAELELPMENAQDVPLRRIAVARRDDAEQAEWELMEPAGLDVRDPERQTVEVRIERGGVYVVTELAGEGESLSVRAGEDRAVDEGSDVQLGATASGGRGTLEVSWSQLAGPEVRLSDATTLAPTFTAPNVTEGTDLRFRVTASSGPESVSDEVTVRVRFVNEPPTAEAGPDQSVTEGAGVTLAGSGSDADGSFTSQWAQLAGPEVTLMDATALNTSFIAPQVEASSDLVLELTITDAAGATASDTLTITVGDTPNAPPAVTAGVDQLVPEQTLVTLDGAATDADGSIVSQGWTQVGGPDVELSELDANSAQFSAPAVSETTTLAFEFTATDDAGDRSSDLMLVAVQPTANLPPSVNAGPDQIVAEQTTVTLDGVASDSDGSVAELVWTQIGGAPEVGLTSVDADSVRFDGPAVVETTPLVFQLTATDDDGAVTSDSVLVTLTPINAAPTVDAGAPQSLTEDLAGALDGTANDGDGTLASITWRQLSGAAAVIADTNALRTTFTPPDLSQPDTLVFELEVVDNEGAAARDTVTFNVLPIAEGNRPPDVYAGPSLIVDSGTVQITEATATDSDGSVTSIAWTQLSGTPVTAFTGQTTLTPSFDVSAVTCGETLVFQLEVRDDQGATSVDTVGVLVNNDYNTPVALGTRFDFEGDDGGFTTDGSLWELDVPTSGPGRAHSGNRAWATNADGNYPHNANETLCLPSFDRAGAARVTLSFYMWSSISGGDAVRIEALDPALGWQPITEVFPAYADTNLPGWRNSGRNSLYGLTTVRIPASATETPKLRFVMQSNVNIASSGAYIDDVAIHSETEDPDGDGLTGIEDEWLTYGTDPFEADTDGDGITDGAEVAAGTDPLNPATFDGAERLAAPFLLDFDTDDGRLVAIDSNESPTGNRLWQHGVPASGPGRAHSPSQAWMTNLDGNYGANERAFLYLPTLDLTATTDPTLAFRLWASCSGGDGMRVEIYDAASGNWVGITPAFPAYDSTDAFGNSVYRSINRQGLYTLAAFPLTDYAGQLLSVRLAFRSNVNIQSSGVYVDDLAVYDETSDADGDGLVGIIAERTTYGSDPFVADTDGDGVDDGVETQADRTDPLDPSDYSGGTVLTVPTDIDFELSNGGFTTTTNINGDTLTDDLWQYGAAASGPGHGHTGNTVWATNLAGNYGPNERAFLNIPPIDLTTATDPTLSFRLWSSFSASDGLSVEIFDPDSATWLTVPVAFPAYNATDAAGRSAWGNVSRNDLYSLVAVSLAPYVGEVIRLRLAVRSNVNIQAPGAYIDDFSIYEESVDPDNDGIDGVIRERGTYGTDPFVTDTDGDEVSDGTEALTDRTDPLDPTYYAGGPTLLPGQLLDFDSDGGGLAAMMPVVGDSDWQPDVRWQRGAVGGGPGGAYSGGSAWATNLTGNYGTHDRSFLHLPPIDLSGVSEATLSFRLWGRCQVSDGLSVQFLDTDGVWSPLVPLSPAYDGTDTVGTPAWRNQGYLSNYTLAMVPLTGLGNDPLVRVRLAFRSNVNLQQYGFAIDDLAVYDESVANPDDDGLIGFATEWRDFRTDPTLLDTDTDGFGDGEEVDAETDPLNPGDDPEAIAITSTSGMLDLEDDDHDFATDGTLWSYGSVSNGPTTGASGARAWATNLSGNYFHNAREYLYAPPIEVGASEDATFGFHLWVSTHGNDGLTCEIWDEQSGWQKLQAQGVPYQGNDASGTPSWRTYESGYVFGAVSLASYAGQTVYLRFPFRSNVNLSRPGAYLDDFVLVDENDLEAEQADPDGDGLPGLLGEYLTYGTDPLSADTDGDGADDSTDADPLDAEVQ